MNSSKPTIGIIGGHDTDDDFDRRVVLQMFHYAASLEYDCINPDEFKTTMMQHVNNERPSGHDVLVAFNELSEEDKKTVLNECCCTSVQLPSFSKCAELLDSVAPKSYFLSEDSVKRELKYCSNPLQRAALNRELNSAKFNHGKHKGSKRRH